MILSFFAEDIDMPEFDQNFVQKGLENLIENEGYTAGEVSIIFTSDKYLLEINKQYLDHHYFTDIITFDYVEDKIVSGDLFISLDRIAENATEFADNFSQELHRVMIHGVLHLCGYKDKTEEEQKEMRSKEDYYLTEMRIL